MGIALGESSATVNRERWVRIPLHEPIREPHVDIGRKVPLVPNPAEWATYDTGGNIPPGALWAGFSRSRGVWSSSPACHAGHHGFESRLWDHGPLVEWLRYAPFKRCEEGFESLTAYQAFSSCVLRHVVANGNWHISHHIWRFPLVCYSSFFDPKAWSQQTRSGKHRLR